MNCRSAGFTLIELVVSLSITTILFLALGALTATLVDGLSFATLEVEIHQTGEIITNAVERELAAAQLLQCQQTGAGAPALTFVVPVDVGEDADGDLALDTGEDENDNLILDLTDDDFTGPGGAIQWGIVEEEGPRLDTIATPHQAVLRFVAEADVVESTVAFDINGDGDLADTFERGSILFATTGGRSSVYGRGMVLLGKDDPSEDVNGDGVPDPLFSVQGEAFTDSDGNGAYSPGENFTDTNGNGAWDGRLRFNLWIFKATGDQAPVRRNFSMAWEVQLDTD